MASKPTDEIVNDGSFLFSSHALARQLIRFRSETICGSLRKTNIKTTSLDPQIGQRNRLSSRDSGKPFPLVHTSVSHIEFRPVRRILVPRHRVLLASRATSGDAPAVGKSLPEGLDRHRTE
jgi:hypothetical protein